MPRASGDGDGAGDGDGEGLERGDAAAAKTSGAEGEGEGENAEGGKDPLEVSSPGPAVAPLGGASARETSAAGKCTAEETRAVLARNGQLLVFPDIAKAVASLRDGDLLWLCNGGHTSDEGLLVEGKRDVTIAASAALLIGHGSAPALEIRGGERILLRGLRLGLETYDDEPVDTLRLVGVRGLAVEGCSVQSDVGTALSLVDVRAAEVRGSRFVGSRIGASAEGSEVTFSASRFAGNAENLGGELAGLKSGALGEGNRLARARKAGFGSRGRRAPKLAPEERVDLGAAFPEGRTFPVITWKDGERYAVLHTELLPEEMPKHPSCEVDEDSLSFICSEPIPAKGALPEGLRPGAWAGLSAITKAGPCALTVGEPVSLETSGCESSMTLALPLTGCGDYAPLVTAGTPPADLCWAPKVEVVGDLGPKTLPSSLRPWIVQELQTTLVDLEVLGTMGPMTRGSSGIAEQGVELAKERWQTRMGGFQIVLSECDAWTPIVVENVMTAGEDRPLKVKLPSDYVAMAWIGALDFRGRLVAFVTRGETETGLVARQAHGGFRSLHDLRHWAENEECLSGSGPLSFGELCGP